MSDRASDLLNRHAANLKRRYYQTYDDRVAGIERRIGRQLTGQELLRSAMQYGRRQDRVTRLLGYTG